MYIVTTKVDMCLRFLFVGGRGRGDNIFFLLYAMGISLAAGIITQTGSLLSVTMSKTRLKFKLSILLSTPGKTVLTTYSGRQARKGPNPSQVGAWDGCDLITVKELLGHSSVKITERYTHSQRELKTRAVESLAGQSRGEVEGREKRHSLLHGRDTGTRGQVKFPVNYFVSSN